MNVSFNMLIIGELVKGDAESLDVINPATGEPITTVPEASAELLEAATIASAEAFSTYSRSTPAERSELLLQIADVLETNSTELAELESLDVGKPWPSALDVEMPFTIDSFGFFAGAARPC